MIFFTCLTWQFLRKLKALQLLKVLIVYQLLLYTFKANLLDEHIFHDYYSFFHYFITFVIDYKIHKENKGRVQHNYKKVNKTELKLRSRNRTPGQPLIPDAFHLPSFCFPSRDNHYPKYVIKANHMHFFPVASFTQYTVKSSETRLF